MARNSLGSLIVTLGLDAAQYVSGLTKAEYEAKKFAERIDRGIATAAKGAGIAFAALGAAGVAAFVAIDQAAKRVGQFKDLEEMTGASAEALASFAVAAAVAGTEMESIADASVKMSKALNGVDGESKKAVAALEALQLNVKEFKALDPAEQMEALASALDKVDQRDRAAVMESLVRGGARLIPFLQELEQQGGRQVILTQKQIEQADAYADAQARATAQLKLYVDAALIQALPAVTALVNAAKQFVIQLTAVDKESAALAANNGVATFAEQGARALARMVDAGDGVIRVFVGIGTAIGAAAAAAAAVASGEFARAKDIAKLAIEDIQALAMKPLFSEALERQFAEQRRTARLAAQEDRGFRPQGRRVNLRDDDPARAARAARERRPEIDNSAREALRLAEEMLRVEDERAKAMFERQAAGMREIDQIRATNQQLEDEIALAGQGADAITARAQARIDEDIALKRLHISFLQQMEDTEAEIENIKTEIELLEQRKVLLAQRDVARTLAEEAQNAKQFYDELGGAIASSFEEAIINGNNLRDVIKGLEQDLVRIITRKMVTEPLANAISGALGGGSGNFLASLFGSGGGIGYGTAGSAIPAGPYPYANGTNYHPGGWAMVGERGPEIVNLPKGAQVIPNSVLQQKRSERSSISIYQSFAPGTDRKTVGQAAAAAGKAVRRGLERNA